MPAVIDQWLLDADGNPDPFASNIDFGMKSEDEINPDNPYLDAHPGLDPSIVRVPPQPPSPNDPVVVDDPPPPPVEEGPETVEFDGGTATLSKEKGQWKLSVISDSGGQPQVYWGKTKNELLLGGLAKAQFNATQKIRELNRKVKLGTPPAPRPTPQSSPVNGPSKTLTADEKFELKTQFEADPDAALEAWYQKKFGIAASQVVEDSREGRQAKADLVTDSVSREFLQRNPDYFGDEKGENFKAIVDWLAKYKLQKSFTRGIDGMYELYYAGYWTVEQIEEAFEDLSKDDFLIKAPRQPKTPTPVKVEEPVPAPRPNERIVRTETRQRAALGIRTTDVTPAPPPVTPTAPTDEDLNSLTDKQIHDLYVASLKLKAASRR